MDADRLDADRLRIERIGAHLVELPFRFSFGHALASRSSSTNLIVMIQLADGSIGYGEGVPREYVTGETAETALARVIDEYGPQLMGRELPDREVASRLRALRDELHLFKAVPGAAWCAVETALLDAIGKAAGRPATDLLGGAARQTVRYGGVAPFASGPALIGLLLFFRAYGFQDVKLKLGRGTDKDVTTVRLARQILGEHVDLRGDANCAWTADEALAMAERLRPYGVDSYEQPVSADDVAGLTMLTAALPEDIVVDESLCSVADARRLIEARACSVLNVRVSKCGGPLAALELVKLADEAGLICQLGAQVGESGILTAAGRLVATVATPGFRHHEGADNLFLLKRDLTVENLTVRPGGRGDALSGRGLGVQVRHSTLVELSTRHAVVGARSRTYSVSRSSMGGQS
ncbi:MAG: mandelate racemase/muconate lactonizing enzyme family protein [Chloroflexota bacterium]